jgi:hypothetical protein
MRIARLLVCLVLSASALAVADPTPGKKLEAKELTSAELAKLVSECQGHPAVTHGGGTVELCMEGHGYVRQGDQWVKKPVLR